MHSVSGGKLASSLFLSMIISLVHSPQTVINANGFLSGDQTIIASLISHRFTTTGDFDGCLDVDASYNTPPFNGKYCLLQLETPQLAYSTELNSTYPLYKSGSSFAMHLATEWLYIRNRFPLAYGICIPSICSGDEVEELIRACKH